MHRGIRAVIAGHRLRQPIPRARRSVRDAQVKNATWRTWLKLVGHGADIHRRRNDGRTRAYIGDIARQ